ncbi:hypothetical protein Tco_1573243, partial [Tanacetum coccineum]
NKSPLKRREFWELINSLKILPVLGKRPSLCKIFRILPAESQRNITDPLVAVTDSLATEYDSVDESSVCSSLFLY